MKQKTVEAAKGKWHSILTRWVDGKYFDGKHHPCPLCGGKDRFRFLDFKGSGSWVCNHCSPKPQAGMELLIQYTGQPFRDLAKEIDEFVGNIQADAPKPEKDFSQIIKRVSKGVQRDIRLTPVYKYLRSRGINIIPANIGYSPACGYYESGSKPMPAMVARVQAPNGDRVGFHVTYLTPDGRKADVKNVKQLRGPHPEGAAVYLAPLAESVVVGEGIETTLAGMQLFNRPGIAALSSGRLEVVHMPETVKEVLILADADRSYTGQKSAYLLANRLWGKGISVSVKVPELGTDFADKLTA